MGAASPRTPEVLATSEPHTSCERRSGIGSRQLLGPGNSWPGGVLPRAHTAHGSLGLCALTHLPHFACDTSKITTW